MNNLTIAQKIYLAALLTAAGAWLSLEIGVPIYEYDHGKSALTALLAHLANIAMWAALGLVALGWVLQSLGILPMPRRDASPSAPPGGAPFRSVRNLILWIVIALLLVFLFNLFQTDGGHRPPVHAPTPAPVPAAAPDQLDMLSLFINWFPMLLIFGVWVFFFRRMQGRGGNNSDGSNNR